MALQQFRELKLKDLLLQHFCQLQFRIYLDNILSVKLRDLPSQCFYHLNLRICLLGAFMSEKL